MKKKVTIELDVDVEYQVLIFDRSNPHDIVASKGEQKWSRLDEIREANAEHGHWFGRSDCAMVNEWWSYHGVKLPSMSAPQHMIYFDNDGNLVGDEEGIRHLSIKHHEELGEIAKRLKAAIAEFPEMSDLMGRSW